MHRLWLWMIPILAALCAIWIQAALHGYEANPFGVDPIVRVDQSVRIEAKQTVSGHVVLPARLSDRPVQPVGAASSSE